MIRAAIGRFVMGCLDAAAAEVHRERVHRVDMDKMSDAELAAFLKGKALPEGHPALVPMPRTRRWRRQ